MNQGSGYARGTILGLKPGQIVDGRFEISKLIGYGGQGVVLEVKHLEWECALALKLPLPDVVRSPKNRERYLQEAETWIRMGVHPNIVRCWFVHSVSGLPGLFLDFITGGSLEDQIKEGKYRTNDWSLTIKALLQVLEGLNHSHNMGVVHRDIKPENILIRADGSICLTDFGLVKSFNDPSKDTDEPDESAPASTDSSVTGSGQFVGTPRYGAPEQWDKNLKIGPATDIYSFGVLFYEMLCGRRPFDAPGEKPDPLELIHRHLKNPPPDPRAFRPEVPPSLAELVLHCLAKDSNLRPQTAQQMIEILSGLLYHTCHETYSRPAPVPGGDRADLLNNAAVSLYSLGKTEKSRELLRRGLLLQAGHPECLYNLVQLDRREGHITAGESIRILRRANAKYQLALLCIEEGLGKQAMDLLQTFPEHEKNGLVHRIEGDALMYAEQYLAAQKAYGKAQGTMPNDEPTRTRKVLAVQGARSQDGHVLFPSSMSCYKSKAPSSDLRLILSWDGQRLIGINSDELVSLRIQSNSLIGQVPRTEDASQPVQTWLSQERLLVQDGWHFELWALDELQMLQRKEGRVLAATRDLKKLILLKRDGVFLLDKAAGKVTQLQFPPGTQPSLYVKACFTPNEAGLCILTPDGRVAQVDAEYRVVPLAWPPPIPRFQELCGFQLSTGGIVYAVGTGGHFQAINLSTQKLNFSLKLPFKPENLVVDAYEQVIVVSSPSEFGVLKLNGKVAFRGEGPMAVDETRVYGLAWCKGYLTLYKLYPFTRIRTFAEKIPRPHAIHFSQNGAMAVSLGADGEHQVWEVDEPNRVFERNLLLTPGESYEQLISSFESYLQLFNQGLRLFAKNRYDHAYVSVKNARRVTGFLQSAEALELQWELCKRLKRSGLEAIWERLYTSDVVASSLSEDQRNLILAQKRGWAIRELGESGGATRLTGKVDSPILSCQYLDSDPANPAVLLLHQDGTITLFRGDDGTLILQKEIGLGPLRSATVQSGSIFLVSREGVLGFFDLTNLELRSSYSMGDSDEVVKAFPLLGDRAFVLSKRGPAVIDAKKQKIKPGLPVVLSELPGDPTFAAETESNGLVLLGFSDGTLTVASQKNGRVLFAVNHKKGPVTGACLNFPMALATMVSGTGGLTLIDLTNGEAFERFTAHNQSIDSLRLSPNARYISTRTTSGQFRFWELSWLLSEQSGNPTIDWLPTGALSKLGRMFRLS
jgi:serine/threonine protein kinase